MERVSNTTLILFYLWGFLVVLMQVVLASLFTVWILQFTAAASEKTYPWSSILSHLILSTYFLMLFPGQKLWTVRLTGPGGVLYTIVGDENANSEA